MNIEEPVQKFYNKNSYYKPTQYTNKNTRIIRYKVNNTKTIFNITRQTRDVLRLILKYLDIRDLLKYMTTSKLVKQLIDDEIKYRYNNDDNDNELYFKQYNMIYISLYCLKHQYCLYYNNITTCPRCLYKSSFDKKIIARKDRKYNKIKFK